MGSQARSRRRFPVRPGWLLIAALALAASALLDAREVVAASPIPSSGLSTDTRSAGQGPGLVGDPLLAVGLVLGIAVAAVLLTTAYVRLTGGPQDRDRKPDRDRP